MDFVRDNALREASLDHENGLLAGIVSVDFDAGSMKGQPPCFTPGLPCNDSKLWSHHRSIQISHCGRSRYQGIMLQFWERKWNKHAFCVVLWVGGWLLLRYCTILIHITIALFCYICCGDEAVQDVLSQRSARDGSTKTSGRFWCCRVMGWYCPMVVTGFAQDHLEASSQWSMLWHTNGHQDSFKMYIACSFLESAHAVRNPCGTRGRAFALFAVSVSWQLQGSSRRISDISWIFMMSWHF